MINFEINNSTKSKLNRKLIEKTVSVFALIAGIKKATFSLAFVGDKEMQKLNCSYRGKDRVTDVLSFAEEKDGFISQSDERNEKYLGEIIICLAQAKRQAREYDWTLDKEIVRLLVHGLAHLIGYDHENVSLKKAKEMQLFEEKVMKKLA
ncbi:MAG: rRNA maturation RNase YbeY [Patescibacteria group bacterium]|jgi:probable rRNA maturation factor